MKLIIMLLGLILILIVASSALADVPKLINFQGILRDSTGSSVADGVYTVRFRIYDDSIAGSTLWEETVPVQTTAGLFAVRLGEATALPNNLFSTGVNRFAAVRVNLDPEITPRTRLVSQSFAFQALRSDTAGIALNVLGGSFLPLAGGTLTGPLSINFASGTGNEVEFTPSPTGAYFDLKDNGAYKASLFSNGDAAGLALNDNGSDATALLNSGTNTGGLLKLNKQNGTDGATVLGGTTTDGASLALRNAAGTEVVRWDADATGSYINTGGNVGIGTNNPLGLLHLKGNNFKQLLESTGNADLVIGRADTTRYGNYILANGDPSLGANNRWAIGLRNGDSKLHLYDELNSLNVMVLEQGGNVGIGTASPMGRLHIANPVGSVGVLIQRSATNVSSGLSFSTGAPTSGKWSIIQFSDGTDHLRIHNPSMGLTAMMFDVTNNRVGIGTTSPLTQLHVQADGDVATFNRNSNDGTIVRLDQAGITEGTISVSGTTVSYNAFTGSHYGKTDVKLERGELVTLTGANGYSHDNPEAEIIYGIKKSAVANDPACLGSYLGLQNPSQPYSSDNAHLIMAVGNGEMWVVDEGKDIQPSDYLISSSTPGHAMKDDERKYPVGHIVARAAEAVDWSTIVETANGYKHKKISVLYGNFVRGNATSLTRTIEEQQEQIEELNKRILKLEAGLLRSQAEN